MKNALEIPFYGELSFSYDGSVEVRNRIKQKKITTDMKFPVSCQSSFERMISEMRRQRLCFNKTG